MTLQHLAVSGYRPLQNVVLPLDRLTLVTGANGSGKSNLYRALRLIVSAARGELVGALAREGGLPAVMWAGPERLSRAMRQGQQPVQGGPRQQAVRLRLDPECRQVPAADPDGLVTRAASLARMRAVDVSEGAETHIHRRC